jgi:2-aminoethylphosphonate transport system permease protein
MSDAAITRRPARALGPTPWIAPPLLLLAALFFYPLALIAGQSLTSDSAAFSLGTYGSVLGGPLFANALWHTIEIAVCATAGCIVLGFALALILSFVPFPGARLISRLVDTVIALPTFLVALAFTFIYGSAGLLNAAAMQASHAAAPPIDFLYTPAGVILAEVTVYTPFIMRPLLAAFSQIEAAQIEVASSLGCPNRPIQRRYRALCSRGLTSCLSARGTIQAKNCSPSTGIRSDIPWEAYSQILCFGCHVPLRILASASE